MNEEMFRITVLSDYNHFKNNMYSVFSLLPIKRFAITNISDIYEIKQNEANLIILNKSFYSNEEIEFLFSIDFKEVSVIVIIDSYFKYKSLFLNFEKGIITIRRPISINNFLEILKNSIYAYKKKKKAINDIKKIRTLEMAKVYLMIYENYFEEEAHKYIENNSMNKRTTLYDESLSIITKYLLLKEDINYEY